MLLARRCWQTLTPDAITHPDLQIGWEELFGEPVDLGSKEYAGLVQQWGHPNDCGMSDKLLMAASQQYEQSSQLYKTYYTEKKGREDLIERRRIVDVPTHVVHR